MIFDVYNMSYDLKNMSYDIFFRSKEMALFMILEPIIGSSNRERILIFLQAREEGYAREIARFFETDLFLIDLLTFPFS